MKSKSLIAIWVTLACIFGTSSLAQRQTDTESSTLGTGTTNRLIYLINANAQDQIDGLLKWETELGSRGLTAMIKASGPVLESYPLIFKRLAAKGHEIIGGYSGVCWDMSYQDQFQAILEVKTEMEALTGKPLQVYACKYSSYDENTIRAAEVRPKQTLQKWSRPACPKAPTA